MECSQRIARCRSHTGEGKRAEAFGVVDQRREATLRLAQRLTGIVGDVVIAMMRGRSGHGIFPPARRTVDAWMRADAIGLQGFYDAVCKGRASAGGAASSTLAGRLMRNQAA